MSFLDLFRVRLGNMGLFIGLLKDLNHLYYCSQPTGHPMGKYYQCPQEIVRKWQSQGRNSSFQTQDPVLFFVGFFFPKRDGPAASLIPELLSQNFFYFTNSEELVIILSLSGKEIHSSRKESLRPGLAQINCMVFIWISAFLWTLRGGGSVP